MSVDIERIALEATRALGGRSDSYVYRCLNESGFRDFDAVSSVSELTGARFAGPHSPRSPQKSSDDYPCAEALIAQWEGLDQKAAVETERTVDLRGYGRLLAAGHSADANKMVDDFERISEHESPCAWGYE